MIGWTLYFTVLTKIKCKKKLLNNKAPNNFLLKIVTIALFAKKLQCFIFLVLTDMLSVVHI